MNKKLENNKPGIYNPYDNQDYLLSNFNEELFKNEHLGLVNKIKDYLDRQGFNAEVHGEFIQDLQQERIKEYEELDLYLTPDENHEQDKTIRGVVHRLNAFVKNTNINIHGLGEDKSAKTLDSKITKSDKKPPVIPSYQTI